MSFSGVFQWQCVLLRLSNKYDVISVARLTTGTIEVHDIIAKLTGYTLFFQNNFIKSQLWVLLPIESTYLPCLINTYAVQGRTKELRRGSRLSARPRRRAAVQR